MPKSHFSYDGLFEWFQAARWAGYTISDFQKQDTSTQAFVMAAYRVDSMIESISNSETNKAQKRPRKGGRS